MDDFCIQGMNPSYCITLCDRRIGVIGWCLDVWLSRMLRRLGSRDSVRKWAINPYPANMENIVS